MYINRVLYQIIERSVSKCQVFKNHGYVYTRKEPETVHGIFGRDGKFNRDCYISACLVLQVCFPPSFFLYFAVCV